MTSDPAAPSRLPMTLRLLASVGGVLAVAGSVALIATGHGGGWWDEFLTHFALFAVFFAVFVWLASRRQSANPVVWVMAASSFCAGWYVAGISLIVALYPSLETTQAPAELPARISWLLVFTGPAGVPPFLLLLTVGLLYFPDGRLPTPRWRWVGLLSIAAIVIGAVAVAWNTRPSSTVPVSEDGPIVEIVFPFVVLLGVVCVISLVGRYRASSGATRQQLKWIAWGASVTVVAFLFSDRFEDGREDLSRVLTALAVVLLVTSYGVAVSRHRLYDIDVVISRTLVYGTLAAFIAGVYVAVVVGLGRLVGGGDDPNPALAIAATAVLAVSFQPLRSRLQRFANRLVFGRRFTPYEVLADFSNRVGSADEALLVEAAHSLVEGTGAESAAIWVGAWATLTRAAVWPPDVAEEPPPSPLVEEHRRVFPVEHGGRVLGALTLTPPRGQTLDGSDQRLAAELAAAMGLTLSNRELTEALRSRVAELQESRLRLVTVQDETRRRLERDLHDGAQQQLVAMKVKLALAAKVASRDGATATAAGLAELIPDVDRTVDEMREFARGIYPPLLEAEGVAAALSALVAKASILVSLQVVGLGRYRRDVESTLYFCLVEALRNVERHAGARSTHISVIDRDGWLTFEVTDDGAGFDRREGTTGTGLDNVEDRLAALDGALEVHTAHGRGTTVTGRVPVRQESLAHA